MILTAHLEFDIAELVSKEVAEALSRYRLYEILCFGYRLRLQLIKKWCLCSPVSTVLALDKRVHDIEAILNTVVGKNLVPSQPIYLLILLQSCELQQQSEIQNSSFAYYYQFLITKSLKEAGLKPNELNEIFNYLAHLAWFFRSSDVREAAVTNLRDFNSSFSARFVSVDLEQRLCLFCQAKVLSKRGDYYSFTYPYVYFFFVGKYLANNLYKSEVQQLVSDWCANLHRRANAHSILFLTHHRSDRWVIQCVSTVLKACFADESPMEFSEDVDSINSLVGAASKLLLTKRDVDHNQEEARALRDEFEQAGLDDSPDEDMREQVDIFGKINLLMKTAEILGQILKNYYGSLERPVKAELLREVLDGPLRFTRALLEEITQDPESLVIEMESILEKKQPNLAQAKKKEAARTLGFRLLGIVCTSIVTRTAQYVSEDKLREDVSALVQTNPTNAYRLIEAATRLTQPGNLPLDEIRRLARNLKSNVFGFTMLQSLAAFHLHLFHTRDSDKQKLCAYLNIKMADSRAIDMKTRKNKLLKK